MADNKSGGRTDVDSLFDPGFPVSPGRFDQKNEMFKRARWDEVCLAIGNRFYDEIKFRDRMGRRQEDFAAMDASWSLDMNFTSGIGTANEGLYDWEGPSGRAPDFVAHGGRVEGSPQYLTRLVKGAATRFGASLVGVARVHDSWIYSHEYNRKTEEHPRFDIPADCRTAVVMAVEMDYETIRSESLVARSTAVGVGYSKMAYLANLTANFIRGLGYRALPSGNDSVLSVPLAMAAGLGESSRMGLLVTPEFGPRVRLCKVFTDIPLVSDSYRPFGVAEFCEDCKTCAEHCPSQAISHGPMTRHGMNVSNHSGALKWYNDHEKCLRYWASIRTDCNQCVRLCPFNKPPGRIHDVSRLMIRLKQPWITRMLVRMDRLMGYHRRYPASRFWSTRK